MKKIISLITLFLTMVIVTNCQTIKKDQIFDGMVLFNQGIQFSDGSIQTTAATGTGEANVTWDAIIGKPLLFPPEDHAHDLLYKSLSWEPSWVDILNKPVFSTVATSGNYNDLIDVPEVVELNEAIPMLNGLILPVKTQAEIDALTPEKGLLLFNDTEGVLQIYNGTEWKIIITNQ